MGKPLNMPLNCSLPSVSIDIGKTPLFNPLLLFETDVNPDPVLSLLLLLGIHWIHRRTDTQTDRSYETFIPTASRENKQQEQSKATKGNNRQRRDCVREKTACSFTTDWCAVQQSLSVFCLSIDLSPAYCSYWWRQTQRDRPVFKAGYVAVS